MASLSNIKTAETVITLIAIAAYSIILFSRKRRITNKIANKGERKKYSKFFTSLLNTALFPIVLFFLLLPTVFNVTHLNKLQLAAFFATWFAWIAQFIWGLSNINNLKEADKNLKSLNSDDLMKTIK